MVDENKRKQMETFLVDRLSTSHEVKPGKLAMPEIDAHYLLVDKHAAVLLVDRYFPEESIEKAYNLLVNDRCDVSPANVGIMIYKDRENFFKSDAIWGYIEKKKGRLSEYEKSDMRKLMQLTPEEIFSSHVMSGRLQYYQPESKALSEGIVQYVTRPVEGGKVKILGFSKPLYGLQTQSYILEPEHEFDGSLQMFGRFIIPEHTVNDSSK